MCFPLMAYHMLGYPDPRITTRRLLKVEAVDDYSSLEEEKDVGIKFEDFVITLHSRLTTS